MSAHPEEQFAMEQAWQMLADGSEYAFTQIFDHYRDKVYSVAWHFLRSSAPAEEIVQDVFLKIWLKRQDLRTVRHPENYLFILARNLLLDHLKSMSHETAARKHWPFSSTVIDDSDHRLRQSECEELLSEALEQLPQRQKEVYLMARTQGLSHEIIAGELQLSRLTVKKHMAEALKFLRKYLSQYLTGLFL
ncbi:MAG TPA: RNA polymerase sigma-70 factor [Puia sp.]|nr:RNA polymerase sigma-70 factor [Puia sp.]